MLPFRSSKPQRRQSSQRTNSDSTAEGLATARPSFIHSRLEDGQIRLFRVTALEPSMQIELKNFSLDQVPHYAALSYAWQNWDFSKRISCNGSVYNITPHLHDGLVSIVSMYGAGWLFVDAICISQNDPYEKASQIAMIDRTFSKAQDVYIWLGVEKDNSNLAMAVMQVVAREMHNLIDFGQWTMRKTYKLPDVYDFLDKTYSQNAAEVHRTFRALRERTWFSRLWVVQEVALAQKAILICGTKSALWSDMETISFWDQFMNQSIRKMAQGREVQELQRRQSKWASIFSMQLSFTIPNIAIYRRSGPFGQSTWSDSASSCLALLNFIALLNCSVEVDRVYSVLGIINPEVRSKIKVNYFRTNDSAIYYLYIDFFQALITYCATAQLPECTEAILNLASVSERVSELPSWCPNIRKTNPDFWSFEIKNKAHESSAGRRHWTKEDSAKYRYRTTNFMPYSNDLRIFGWIIGGVTSSAQLTIPKDLQTCENAPLPVCEQILHFIQSCTQSSRKANMSKTDLAILLQQAHHVDQKDEAKREVYRGRLNALELRLHERKAELTDPKSSQTAIRSPTELGLELWSLRNTLKNKAFFSAKYNQYERSVIGLGSSRVADGDIVCIFEGMSSCHIVRRNFDDASTYKYVGPAEINGFMKGEVFDLEAKNLIQRYEIILK